MIPDTLKQLKNYTILYIEDEPLIRRNAVEYLSRYCHHVLEAKDGHEGYSIYEANRPDLIISDIKMPKRDGLTLAKMIRQEDKNTPIIITTAHTDTEYLLKAVELQLIKYLIKPLTPNKLHEALGLACHVLKDKQRCSVINLDHSMRYDTLNNTLFKGDEMLKLTHNERLFFDFLVTNRQRVATYEEIESLIWAYEGMSMDALRSLVRGLRKKLGDNYIENISGIGYKLLLYPSA